MLQAAAFGSPQALDKFAAFINAMLAFEMPRAPSLLDSKGVAFLKPGSANVRPIAISEAWLRLAGAVALALLGDAGAALAPEQQGVGISGGAVNVGHALKSAIAADPEHTIIYSHDWANAFNTVSRQAIFDTLKDTYPSLVPFVNFLYGMPSTVHFFSEDATTNTPITSSAGVRQGDPLGPFLFALVSHRLLKKVAEARPSVHPLAYSDDTYLVARGPDILYSIDALAKEGAAIGLTPSPHKCLLYGTPGTSAWHVAGILSEATHIHHAEEGFIAAGTPIGTTAFVRGHLQAKADAVVELIRKLTSLPAPLTAQSKYLLIARSLQRRLTHFTRVCHPDDVHAPLTKIQAAAEDALLSIFHIHPDPQVASAMGLDHALVRQQLRLPNPLGGFALDSMGVTPDPTPTNNRLTRLLHLSSYLSAAAHCHNALAGGPPSMQPFSQLHWDEQSLHAHAVLPTSHCATWWRVLLSEVPAIALHPLPPQPKDIELAGVFNPAVILDSRKQVVQHVATTLAQEHFHASATSAHHCRMLSLRCRHAGAFLDTVPVSPHLQLSDADFISGCQFRLGATGTNPHIPALTCYCGMHIQGSDVDHAMCCNKLSGARSRRHDLWKAALSRLTSRAGVSTRMEPHYADFGQAAAGRQGARADIHATMPPPHGPTLIDVSIIHPRSSTVIAHAARNKGSAAAFRDRQKYRANAGHQHAGYVFIPASVETYGHLGKPLVGYIRALSDVAACRTVGVTRGSFLASAYRELSVALVRSQGFVYRACANLLARASGGQVLEGSDVPFLD
jgi:hypothetical protein